MSSFVRSSKFRNIVVKPFKREENTYENIQVSDGVPWSQDMEIVSALALGFWRTSINPAVVAA